VPALILRICLPGTGTLTPHPAVSGALLLVDDLHQDTAGLNTQASQPQSLRSALWHFCQLLSIAGPPQVVLVVKSPPASAGERKGRGFHP